MKKKATQKKEKVKKVKAEALRFETEYGFIRTNWNDAYDLLAEDN